jgi:hypothetical protein
MFVFASHRYPLFLLASFLYFSGMVVPGNALHFGTAVVKRIVSAWASIWDDASSAKLKQQVIFFMSN